MTILPIKLLRYVRPVAAEEYFFRNPVFAWFSKNIIGVIPISRCSKQGGSLTACSEALEDKNILIFFPEGTRGQPERMQNFKCGIEHLARQHTCIPIIPVYMHGLGKALPKGEHILVPFFCDVFVGEPISWNKYGDNFMSVLDCRMKDLASEVNFSPWN